MIESIKQVVDIFSGLIAPLTAACVGYIAYRQWKNDDLEKKKRDIEKRISIYKAVSEHLSYVDRTLKVDPKLYDIFRRAHCEAKFYFPPAVDEYLKIIDINSHQWLLEYNLDPEKNLTDNEYLNENIDELTTCSVNLDSKMSIYVLKENI